MQAPACNPGDVLADRTSACPAALTHRSPIFSSMSGRSAVSSSGTRDLFSSFLLATFFLRFMTVVRARLCRRSEPPMAAVPGAVHCRRWPVAAWSFCSGGLVHVFYRRPGACMHSLLWAGLACSCSMFFISGRVLSRAPPPACCRPRGRGRGVVGGECKLQQAWWDGGRSIPCRTPKQSTRHGAGA